MRGYFSLVCSPRPVLNFLRLLLPLFLQEPLPVSPPNLIICYLKLMPLLFLKKHLHQLLLAVHFSYLSLLLQVLHHYVLNGIGITRRGLEIDELAIMSMSLILVIVGSARGARSTRSTGFGWATHRSL